MHQWVYIRFSVGYSMEKENYKESKLILRAECENCEFKANKIEIVEGIFLNNTALPVNGHLILNNTHIIRFIIGKTISRIRIINGNLTSIDNIKVLGE